MKKLNIYYIVSIIALVFMIFILLRTLQVTGWFEDHHGQSPAERVLQNYPGVYQLKTPIEDVPGKWVRVELFPKPGDEDWYIIRIDSLPGYMIELSDFEDEQILIEIYNIDSSGNPQRLEGCELLLAEDTTGNFSGGTIGDFCGLMEQSTEYLALDLLLSDPIVSLEIQRQVLGHIDSLNKRNYLLERLDEW